MKGLDLSKFQKVSEDENVTKLQHPDGHEIMISHAAISPKQKEQLKTLKMAHGGKVKALAFAGPVDEAPEVDMSPVESVSEETVQLPGQNQFISAQAPTKDMDPSSPALVEDSSAGIASAPVEQTFEGTTELSPQAPASSQTDLMGPQPQQMAQPVSYTPPTPEEQKAQYAQHYAQESDMFNDDLVKGLIKPKTVADLYHDKSTLGKVGTIFGMMLSSMGSGLTHQPNALMELMQKQIDNDLQAQKSNVTNRQSFYQLNLQQKKNEADILKTKADTLMQQALMSKVPQEKEYLLQQANFLKQQAKGVNINAQLDAQTLASNQAMQAAFHSLATSPAAQTPAGQQALGVMYQAMQKSIISKNDAAAGAKAFANTMLGGNGQTQQTAGPVNMEKLRGLQMTKTMPEGDVARANEEASHLMNLGAYQDMYNESFEHLNTVSAGKLKPADREASENAMLNALTQAGIPEAKAKAFIPQIGDTTETRRTKKQAAEKAFKAELLKTPTLMKWGLLNGTQQATKAPKQTQAVAGGPEIRYDAQGNRWVMGKDGKPVKLK